jgi:hypothetical protein
MASPVVETVEKIGAFIATGFWFMFTLGLLKAGTKGPGSRSIQSSCSWTATTSFVPLVKQACRITATDE